MLYKRHTDEDKVNGTQTYMEHIVNKVHREQEKGILLRFK